MKSSIRLLPFEHIYKIGRDAIITQEDVVLE